MKTKNNSRSRLFLLVIFFCASLSASLVFAQYNTYLAPPRPEDVDFAITAVKNPRLSTQDKLEGVLIPFVIDNKASKEYGVEIHLICSDFKAEQVIFPVKPGKSAESIFHPLQESAIGRYEGMSDFTRGKKVELCSLNIAHIQQEDFSDLTGPADSDITNNSFTFKLTFANRIPAVSDVKRDMDNSSERVKKLKRPLSDEELKTYASLSQEKCLNVLISSEDRGWYYNGEPVDPEEKIRDVHIAGDRIGYVKMNSVIIDGEDVGSTNVSDDQNRFYEVRPQLKLNEKHFAFFRLMSLDRKRHMPTYHLIYDGEDFGEAAMFSYKLSGDYIIHETSFDRDVPIKLTKHKLFANGKKIADGGFGDYDGKNLAYVDTNGSNQVIYNGKKMGYGYGGEIVLKDGHFVFARGQTEQGVNPRIIYDGKDLGRGREPVIEKNHLAFIRAAAEIDPKSSDQHPRVIYDGKQFGYVGGFSWKISLAGDHIAYMRGLEEKEKPFEYAQDFAQINIDGVDYPGNFLSDGAYVEISEKHDRSQCM